MRSLIWIKLCRNFNRRRLKLRALSGRKQAELDLCQPRDDGLRRKVEANFSAIHMTTVSPDLLRRFDIAGPRYTSYPTADRFVDAFGASPYLAHALSARRERPRRAAAAVALRAHPVLRVAVLLLRLQQDRHEDTTGRRLPALLAARSSCTPPGGGRNSRSAAASGGGTPTFLPTPNWAS